MEHFLRTKATIPTTTAAHYPFNLTCFNYMSKLFEEHTTCTPTVVLHRGR